MKKRNRFQFIKQIVVPFILISFWAGATLLQIALIDKSFSVLSYNYSKNNFTKITYEKLFKGDKVQGEFQAKDNNLGIVAVRFDLFARPDYKDEDALMFRLKEKGAKEWYYENKYRSGLIYDVPFFPFGFPKIPDSKDKTYIFEIESLKGNKINAVAISQREPILASKYQILKSELLEDKQKLAVFLSKKYINAFQTLDIKYASFVFFLPFIAYIFLVSSWGAPILNKLSMGYRRYGHIAFIWIIISLIATNILYLQLTYNLVYLVLTGVWIVITITTKFTSHISFGTGLCCLILADILLLLQFNHKAELSAAWALMFLFAGIIHSIRELPQKKMKHS